MEAMRQVAEMRLQAESERRDAQEAMEAVLEEQRAAYEGQIAEQRALA